MKKINLTDIGLNCETAAEAAKLSGLFPARVSAQFKGRYTVMAEDGEMPARISGKFRFEAGAQAQYPAVGDWVLIDDTGEMQGEALIHGMLGRKTCLARKAAGTGELCQVIAANVDIVFICMSANQDFNLRRLERYLSVVWESRAIPVIVLTKADLTDDLESRILELEESAPGVDITVVSAKTEDGLCSIQKYIQKSVTIAFVGSSGVGKSSLINCLLGREALATGKVREDDDKGRHITTTRQMFILPGGGIVIDTPGMRELRLSGADVEKAFADIEEIAAYCRFGDCTHSKEPGCAVKKAVEKGDLSPARVESYKKLKRELEFEEHKHAMTAAQAEKAKTIRMIGSLKAHKQIVKEKSKGK